MESLFKKVATGEFQDEENIREAASRLGKAIMEAWKQPNDALVVSAHEALVRAMGFPEHKQSAFGNGAASVALALARAQVADNEMEFSGLLAFVLREFTFNAPARREIIALASAGLHHPSASITLRRLCLETIRVILDLSSSNASNSKSAHMLVGQQLMPLHGVQGKISPTQSLLGAFHKEITLCLTRACSLANNAEAWELAITDLAGPRYPNISEGNSPKEVLFLHELEKLVADSNQSLTGKARSAVATRLLQSVSSLHAAVCERALSFWRSDEALKKLQGSDNLLSKTCDRALAKTSMEHWSATVKSMAGAALLRSRGLSTTSSTPASNSLPPADASLNEAIQKAKEREQLALAAKPPQTLPLPKSFSSTSVIRDATEPFAYGAFGTIWKGRAIVAGASRSQWPLVALKELEDPHEARKEAKAMQLCGSHPNLVTLLGTFDVRKGTALSLVLEFVEGPGDLHTCVVDRGPLSADSCRFIAGELGAALSHMHAAGVVFGDVKPENVLLTNEGHVKLCDFGSAFSIDEAKSAQTLGTVEYMPPEQVSSFKGDWWAFGCVIHFALTGRPPVFFDTEDEADLAAAFSRAVTFADQQGGSLLKDVSARQLVASLCSRNPNNRPEDGGESASFFNGFRPWKDLAKRTDVPKLPPSRGAGASKTLQGPWQRRTFSTIHSPMPKAYSGDAEFVNLCVGNTKTLADLALPQDWNSAASSMAVQLDSAFFQIPRQRTPAPQTNGPLATSVGGGNKKLRRVQPNYVVAGVDLSAG